MKKVVRSPGSATIINAIATGFGSAFGIGLDIVCNAKTQSHSITCSNDVGADTSLMELCVSNVFDYYGVDADEFGLDIKTTSELPMASGLSSSSALSNAVTAISSKIISEEFNLEPLSDFDIINLAIESSLKAKVTITGAFDDATASYFGGVTVTDNGARKILIKEPMEELPVLVYMPNFISKSGSSDVNKMKLMAPLVETAFEIAKNKNYFKALNLNGLIYAAALGFDSSIAIEALNAGALASGLSGTGSSFVAICEEDKIDDIKEAWSLLDGHVIETFSDNEGCSFI
ncbi:MAG: shikimate kinase [Methanobrevibacter woesei]|uniref:shikimate kinase n=1 Tax=Methanobrevibacter woesei TaxID=190976 RepID=UPI0023F55C60|nr:shikimate kinase [Methanobrevibacter woesei]MCI7292148.1 shikimate kinase [Methanobrevibacter woesei]